MTFEIEVNGRLRSVAIERAGTDGRFRVTVDGETTLVEARQPVVVVEAMKMENELRSPKAGRVKDVAVTPGTSVEAGRVLVVID